MRYGPEWLAGWPHVSTTDPVHLWLYLLLPNALCVLGALGLLWQSWGALRAPRSLEDEAAEDKVDTPYSSPVKPSRYNLRKRN